MYLKRYIRCVVPTEKKLHVRFYTEGGSKPVLEFLQELAVEDRKTIGFDMKTVELGWPVGMPLVKPLKKGLFEVRSDISQGRIARVLFCTVGPTMVLLHAFIKKSQKTPKGDLELARARQSKVEAEERKAKKARDKKVQEEKSKGKKGKKGKGK